MTPPTVKSIGATRIVAETNGAIHILIEGMPAIGIPGYLRHAFLDKIRKSVEMADMVDPDNDQLHIALK